MIASIASKETTTLAARPHPSELDIRRTAALRRTNALFKSMASDFLLREQFVTEPTRVLTEYVHSDSVAADRAEASDQLVYAVMASPGLLAWLRDYAMHLRETLPSRDQFMHDMLRAAVAEGAYHVIFAIARADIEGHDVLGRAAALPVLLDLIVHGAGGIFAQTEMSTGHSTGTEMSTGHVFATEMSTGHSGTQMSTGHSTGTQMSTGHVFATEMSTGHSGTQMSTGHSTGTQMSTGHVFATEMSTGHSGTQMSTGHSTGTQMSTGHVFATETSTGHSGTEKSTGHSTGTEKSTGHTIGPDVFRPGFQRVALAALADYAGQLRVAGALDRIFVR
jgi:hypothetical protein